MTSHDDISVATQEMLGLIEEDITVVDREVNLSSEVVSDVCSYLTELVRMGTEATLEEALLILGEVQVTENDPFFIAVYSAEDESFIERLNDLVEQNEEELEDARAELDEDLDLGIDLE